MKELKIVNELDLGVPVRGSYVVGNYIYILADILYRAPISGDSVGALESLNIIVNPNSIISDGTYLYVGGRVNSEGSHVFVVRIIDFVVATTKQIHATIINRILLRDIDIYGNLHLITNRSEHRVYQYDPDINNVTELDSVGSGTDTTGLCLFGDYAILNSSVFSGNTLRSSLCTSWDGTTLTRLYFQNDPAPLGRLTHSVVFKGMLFGVPSTETPTSKYLVYTANESEFTVVSELGHNGSQRQVDTDGDYVYSLGGNQLTVLNYENEEIKIEQIKTLPASNDSRDFPQLIHCGNNRVYVSNGNKLYTLRWHVKAGFTVSNSNPAVGETITFSAIQ